MANLYKITAHHPYAHTLFPLSLLYIFHNIYHLPTYYLIYLSVMFIVCPCSLVCKFHKARFFFVFVIHSAFQTPRVGLPGTQEALEKY